MLQIKSGIFHQWTTVHDVSLLTFRAYSQAHTMLDTCIGYNTLFLGPDVPRHELDNGEDLPEGQRLWSWLILTEDGTH